MSPEWLLHEGELVASSLVFSHTEQLDRLRASCPAALDAALVAGDPALDRMLASIPLRRTYRDAFGVQDGQHLIFVSSTWGPDSLYGTTPTLIQRLRSELPLDDYTLSVALHPNTWSAHSPWQIHRWLDACARAGVIVAPPEEGWRAALIAADLVVGDHGSVTFYAGALGKPVLLANSAGHTVDPASAVGRFVAAADHVEASALLPQVKHAIARGQSPEQREAAALATSAPLKSFALLREEFYRLLALPEPDSPALTPAVPVLHATPRSPAAQAVEVTLTYEPGVLHATARRFAAELAAQGCPPPQGAHLVVSSDEPDQDMLQLADIVVHEGPGDAKAWITDTLSALPGAMLASMPVDDTTWLVGTRDVGLLSFTAPGPHGRTCASVVLSWLISGHSLHAFPQHVELHTGTTRSSGSPIACTYLSATA
ncbi:hypothetical protein GCM10011609_85650 [Lentzea pudingi]|uniref:Uncharacterized protein n=1 Tax=Lentzea pudingi TaxID=1789439 RepID=A0ABQ2ITT5_9PSEU|nr:hypothetical protein GCM10011609_85650 [Lentzea pudingi]